MISPRRLLLDLDGTLTASPETLLALRFTWKTASRLKKFRGWTRALRALGAVKEALERAPGAPGGNDSAPLKNEIRAIQALARGLGVDEPLARKLLSENATEFLQA